MNNRWKVTSAVCLVGLSLLLLGMVRVLGAPEPIFLPFIAKIYPDSQPNPSPTSTPSPNPPDCDWFPCAYIAYLVSRDTDDYEYIQIHKAPYNDYADMTDWMITVEYDNSGEEDILFVFPPWYLDDEYWTVLVDTGYGYVNPTHLYMFYDQHMFSGETCVRLYNDDWEFVDQAYKPAGNTYDIIPGDCDQPTPTPTPTSTPIPTSTPVRFAVALYDIYNHCEVGEYVTIGGAGPFPPYNISGWRLESNIHGHLFTFPVGSFVDPSANVYTGLEATPDPVNYYMGYSESLYCDSPQCITIFNHLDEAVSGICW